MSDLKRKTKKELIELAKEKGININSTLKKHEIIDIILSSSEDYFEAVDLEKGLVVINSKETSIDPEEITEEVAEEVTEEVAEKITEAKDEKLKKNKKPKYEPKRKPKANKTSEKPSKGTKKSPLAAKAEQRRLRISKTVAEILRDEDKELETSKTLTKNQQERRIKHRKKVLTVEADAIDEAPLTLLEKTDRELMQAYAGGLKAMSKRTVLTGVVGGVMIDEKHRRYIQVYYNEHPVPILIPFPTFFVDYEEYKKKEEAGENGMLHLEREAGRRAGYEVDFVIELYVKHDKNSSDAVILGNRLEAMRRKREDKWFAFADDDNYLIREDDVIEARICNLGTKAINIEVFGVETRLSPEQLSYSYITDINTDLISKLPHKDKIKVKIKEITRNLTTGEVKFTANHRELAEDIRKIAYNNICIGDGSSEKRTSSLFGIIVDIIHAKDPDEMTKAKVKLPNGLVILATFQTDKIGIIGDRVTCIPVSKQIVKKNTTTPYQVQAKIVHIM